MQEDKKNSKRDGKQTENKEKERKGRQKSIDSCQSKTEIVRKSVGVGNWKE